MTVLPLERIAKPGTPAEQQVLDGVACRALGQDPIGALARCRLCGEWLGEIHLHLWHVQERRSACACRRCETRDARNRMRGYRRMQPRVELLEGFEMSEAMWVALTTTVGLANAVAFFFRTSRTREVKACGPGRGESLDVIETTVDPEAWATLVDRNPVLNDLESDVEALLVHRLGLNPEHYRVSINLAYRLTGLARGDWTVVPATVRDFFTALRRGGL